MIILNKDFCYKIRTYIVLQTPTYLPHTWVPGLPPAKSAPVPQWDTTQ